MITPAYAETMARYNAWQNRSIYAAATTLEDGERKRDRGAFFGSIHGTLNHLLWGDQLWLHRFSGSPKPRPQSIAESVDYHDDFAVLRGARAALDEAITAWAGRLEPAWLATDLSWYSAAAGRQVTKSSGLLVVHFFNHQTHHRGQVHAMLTAAGARPEDTDLPFMPG